MTGSMCGHVLVFEYSAKSVLEPVPDMAYLEEPGQDGHKDTGTDKRDQHGKSPHEIIDGCVNSFNQLHFSSPLNPKKTDADILVSAPLST